MAVVRFDPEEQDTALAAGVVVPRGTLLRSNIGKGERTACTFQTAHEVRLLPLRLAEARYFTRDVSEVNLPAELRAKAAIRIRLQVTSPVPLHEVTLDPVTFFLRRADQFPALIYEQIILRQTGLQVQH